MTKEWEKLTAYRHARLRTEMYFGSRDPHTHMVLEYGTGVPVAKETTFVPAVFTAFREVLDNALDECVTHGHGDRVDVTYDPDTLTFSVADNGRGIPINFDETEGKHAVTVLLSETMAGRNFTESTGAKRGMNGVGASVTNFCSEWFQVDVERGGQSFSQRFSEGEELVIGDPVILPSASKTSGTKVTFKLSSKVFAKTMLPESFVRARMVEVALIYPKLKVFYSGERITPPKTGIDGLFGDKKPITIEINRDGFSSRFWLIPNFFADGAQHEHSLVNAIPTINGGTHIDAFKRGFYSGLLTAMASKSKQKKLQPNRSDIEDGVLLFNVTEMTDPSFDSQNKTRLINEEVDKTIKAFFSDLSENGIFKTVLRKHPDWIDAIYERCAARTMRKDAEDARKLSRKNLRTKIEDLEDACSSIRSKCTLFLAEGKSAISGMVDARDAEIHGGLPLRGKILNTHPSKSLSIKEVMANETLTKIMNAIGLEPYVRANRHALRYGRVHVTTDADEDGKNIAAQLVNFFYTYWPDLFDPDKEPFIWIFDTPLIIAAKGKQRKYWYNEDYDDFDPEQYKGWDVTRAKGLAALKKPDWQYVLANPKARPMLDKFYVNENGEKVSKLHEALDLLFNEKRADDRKVWIGK